MKISSHKMSGEFYSAFYKVDSFPRPYRILVYVTCADSSIERLLDPRAPQYTASFYFCVSTCNDLI